MKSEKAAQAPMNEKAAILVHRPPGMTRYDSRAKATFAQDMATISVNCAAYSNCEEICQEDVRDFATKNDGSP